MRSAAKSAEKHEAVKPTSWFQTVIRLLLIVLCAFFFLLAAWAMLEGQVGLAAMAASVALFFSLILHRNFRRAKPAASSPAAAPPGPTRKPASLATPIVIVLFVLGMDAMVSMPLLAGGAAFWSATAGLLWALAAFRDRRVFLMRMRAVAIVLGPTAAVTGYGWHDNRLARERVTATAESLKVYKAKHGAYPDRLDVLVPEYFSEPPKARAWGMGSRIYYRRAKDGSVALMYVEVPPFGRSALDVDSGKWSYLD
jgi:hypothetical protein